uniref:Uncharacterized protein n=2 Tax=Lankesteria abbotti TaxID=340204 RepID=A0A7S2VU79_9APIC|mmetsp:Transcript_2462/g.2889  ORF Transcript_2462/g.2889 Transcript_2462/m.2889 type:complete len:123 (+) Transcript_2462:58-426(+)
MVYPTVAGFVSLFLTSAEIFPLSSRDVKFHVNVSKGGNAGLKYMLPPAYHMLREQNMSLDLTKIVLVGDDLSTDIVFGNAAGMKTVFVDSTGVHRRRDLRNWPSKPFCSVRNLKNLVSLLDE